MARLSLKSTEDLFKESVLNFVWKYLEVYVYLCICVYICVHVHARMHVFYIYE